MKPAALPAPGHSGWGLRCHRPLPRAGPPRRSRRRGRPVAQWTSAGPGGAAGGGRQRELAGEGRALCRPPALTPLRRWPSPSPSTPRRAIEGVRKAPARPGVPLPPPLVPPTPLPLGGAASALTGGSGTQAVAREVRHQQVYLTRGGLVRPGSRPASAPPPRASALPGEDRSRVLGGWRPGPVSPHRRAAPARAPLPGTSAARPQPRGSARRLERPWRSPERAGPFVQAPTRSGSPGGRRVPAAAPGPAPAPGEREPRGGRMWFGCAPGDLYHLAGGDRDWRGSGEPRPPGRTRARLQPAALPAEFSLSPWGNAANQPPSSYLRNGVAKTKSLKHT